MLVKMRGMSRKNWTWLKLAVYFYFFIVSFLILGLLIYRDHRDKQELLSTTKTFFSSSLISSENDYLNFVRNLTLRSENSSVPSPLSASMNKSIFEEVSGFLGNNTNVNESSTSNSSSLSKSHNNHSHHHTTWGKFKIQFKNLQLDYEMTEPSSDFCDGKTILALIVTRADMEGYLFRRAIRKSWLKKDRVPVEVAYKFIVGKPVGDDASSMSLQLLEWELKHYDDMLITTIPDLYENLFLKTHALLQWKVSYCPNAKILLKIDDDTAMSLERLSYWFHKEIINKMQEFPVMALCNVLKEKVPYREEWFRWQVPVNEFPDSMFPDYCNGAIYMLTDQAAVELLSRTRYVGRMRLEDVLFTGVLGQMANLTRFNTPAFSYDIITYECSDEKVPLQMGIYGLPYSYIEGKYADLMNNINCSAKS